MLIKADVAQFFMSGTHVNLYADVKHFVGDRLRESLEEANYFILDNQYVNLSLDQVVAKKVIIGAGMGMNCAGKIADLAFFLERERPFLLDRMGEPSLMRRDCMASRRTSASKMTFSLLLEGRRVGRCLQTTGAENILIPVLILTSGRQALWLSECSGFRS